MKTENLQKAVDIGKKAGSVCVATADVNGMPHIAAAKKLELAGENCVAVTEWFCPGTVANLQKNKRVAIAVLEKASDSGYQLLGQLKSVEDVGVLDGYAPGLEGEPPLPQVEKRLTIDVKKVIAYRLGPHSDAED